MIIVHQVNPLQKKPESELEPHYLSNSSFIKFLDLIDDNMDKLMEYINEQFQGDDNMPPWAKYMYAKLCNIDSKQDEVKNQISDFMTTLDFLDNKIDNTITNNKKVNQ